MVGSAVTVTDDETCEVGLVCLLYKALEGSLNCKTMLDEMAICSLAVAQVERGGIYEVGSAIDFGGTPDTKIEVSCLAVFPLSKAGDLFLSPPRGN